MTDLTPKPVPKDIRCSVCDMPWEDHKGWYPEPGHYHVPPSECIRLLKEELARRPTFTTTTIGGSGQWPNVLPGNGYGQGVQVGGAPA